MRVSMAVHTTPQCPAELENWLNCRSIPSIWKNPIWNVCDRIHVPSLSDWGRLIFMEWGRSGSVLGSWWTRNHYYSLTPWVEGQGRIGEIHCFLKLLDSLISGFCAGWNTGGSCLKHHSSWAFHSKYSCLAFRGKRVDWGWSACGLHPNTTFRIWFTLLVHLETPVWNVMEFHSGMHWFAEGKNRIQMNVRQFKLWIINLLRFEYHCLFLKYLM